VAHQLVRPNDCRSHHVDSFSTRLRGADARDVEVVGRRDWSSSVSPCSLPLGHAACRPRLAPQLIGRDRGRRRNELRRDLTMLQWLESLLGNYGYVGVGLIVALESMGLPLPGETVLLAAAAYAGAGGPLNIVGAIGSAAAGAILGDTAGYWLGRLTGLPLLERYGWYVWLSRRKSTAPARSSNGMVPRPSSSVGSSPSCGYLRRLSPASARCRTGDFHLQRAGRRVLGGGHGRSGVHPRQELATSRALGAVVRTGRGGRPGRGGSFSALPASTPEQSRGRVVSMSRAPAAASPARNQRMAHELFIGSQSLRSRCGTDATCGAPPALSARPRW
jgi:hypothetical protein